MTDDLTTITGVGEITAEALREVGFETADEVESASVDELVEADHVGESTARSILGDDEADYNGRPSRLDEVYEDVMQAAERGLTYEGIARVAGIGRSTLDDWRRENPEFERALEQKRAVGEQRIIQRVEEQRPEFILERSYGYTKEQEIEHTGDAFDLTLSADEKEQLDEMFDREPQETDDE